MNNSQQTLSITDAFQIAFGHHQARRLAQAEQIYRQILQTAPDHADALHCLGVLAHQCGRHEEALGLIRRALAVNPRNHAYHLNLGPVLRALGRLDEAIASYRAALALAPDDSDAWNNLGNAHRQLGDFGQAVGCYEKARALRPADALVHVNLGGALCDQERLDDAAACFEQALALRPGYAEALNDLGKVRRLQNRLADAATCFKQAIASDPGNFRACSNLAGVLKVHGKSAEAIFWYRRALEIKPDYADAFSNMLFAMQYADIVGSQELFAEHLRYAERFEAPLKAAWQPHANLPDPNKRLRIGYVSADFNQHALAYFIEPVLACHDKAEVEVFCYYNGTRRDPVTARFEALADHWLPCRAWSDEQLAARIRQDGIDILVDLSGHTAGNRLLTFARKPAPLQLTWLGYFGTSGLSAMDYRFTDECMDPPGFADTIHTEKLLRLPHFSPFQPAEGCPPVMPLPALASGRLTFASLNNLAKINQRVVRLWSRILHALPGSRLMLCNIGDGESKELLLHMFALEGVGPERLLIQPWMDILAYLALHHQIDLALDPFPYNGGTITNHSLWMGVPVVTLAGDRSVGRIGVSLMTRADLPQFIASDEDGYLACVLRQAQDLPALDHIRQTMRQRLTGNAEASAQGLCASMEDAYRAVWRDWCAAAAQTLGAPAALPDMPDMPRAASAARQGSDQALAPKAAGDANRHNSLGNAARDQGRLETALANYRDALALQPDFVFALLNAANVLKDLGRLDEAFAHCQRALAARPDFAGVYNVLGTVLQERGQFAPAAAHYEKALALQPDYADAHANVAGVFMELNRIEAALEHCRRALALDPRHVAANLTLGHLMQARGQIDMAVDGYRKVTELKPDFIPAWNNLGAALHLQGNLDAALESYRKALALQPHNARVHSNLLFTMSAMDTMSAGAAAGEYLEQALRYGASVAAQARPFGDWPQAMACEPPPLRVGLVSGDLLNHPVGYFLEHLLARIDPGKIALAAYPSHVEEDDLSARIKPRFCLWRCLHGLSDAEAASQIRADGIHVLIDLAGHTARNRLPLFAWRAAPLQVAWLGFWASTGMAEIDFLLADPVSAPLAAQPQFCETLWHLPDTRMCFSIPLEDGAPQPGALPALSAPGGGLTFGSFQNLFKITDAVLRLWGRVLEALPQARLRLQNKQMGSQSERARLLRRLGEHGIAPDRVVIAGPVPRAAYLAAHAEIDIILDTFPYSGGTTTCEALWMGVPTLTLAGQTLLARQGMSLLGCAGLADWIAADAEQYLALALAKAADLPALARLRARLRAQVLASPLFDADRFARNLEQALYGMWRRKTGASLELDSPGLAAEALYRSGLELAAKGELEQAGACFRQAIALAPGLAEAHGNLGNVLQRQGEPEASLGHYRTAVALKPGYASGHNNLGNALRDLSRLDEALASYRSALAANPELAEAHSNMGTALRRQGKFDEAIVSYQNALALRPSYVEARLNLGNALKEQGRLNEALAAFRLALTQQPPGSAELHNSLGAVLQTLGQPEQAIEHYRTAIRLGPDLVQPQVNLVVALQGQGALRESIELCRNLLARAPDCVEAQTNLLFAMSFDADTSPRQYLAQALQFGRAAMARANPGGVWPLAARAAGQPLRVGLVSGDLRNHPVGHFLENVLRHVDPARLELRAYPCREFDDDLASRIKPLFLAWTPLFGLSDQAAAKRIEADGIHVLIDLAGHTGHNRLQVFAYKPAPLQVAWLGYWASTGLPAIDFVLADPVSAPTSEQEHFCETLWRLPDTRLCFTPPGGAEQFPLAALPALRPEAAGAVTFACFQNLSKIGDAVLALWCEVLRALPQARLRLQNREMNTAAGRERFLRRLAAHGIEARRVTLAPPTTRSAYLAAYAEVDMVLDTFPYTGGTTTCEALWMGVPTLTLAGGNMLGRQGASLLTCAGLADWVAVDGPDFVRRACAKAGDLDALARLRAGLRQQVLASPLFDAARFARHLEDALEAMWRQKTAPDGAPEIAITGGIGGIGGIGGNGGIEKAMAAGQQTASRNDPCPCGSGKKYKQCCQQRQQTQAAGARAAALSLAQALQSAQRHQQAGRLPQAEAIYRQILAQTPEQPDALHYLGVIAHQLGRHDTAASLIRQALALQPSFLMHANLGLALKAMGQLEAAVACQRQAVRLKPDFAQGRGNLVAALLALGNGLAAQGRLAQAADAYLEVLSLQPKHIDALANLGTMHQAQGKLEPAIACFRQVLSIQPGLAAVHDNLGNALQMHGDSVEAVGHYRKAIALQPDFAACHGNLGYALQTQGRLGEALACLRRAVALDPDYAEGHNNLGNAFMEIGDRDAMLHHYRKGLALKPDSAMAHSNLLFSLSFSAEPMDYLEQARRFGQELLARAQPFQAWPNAGRDGGAPLRVGLVSGDLRSHPVGHFLEALLARIDPAKLQLFAYASSLKEDALSARIKPCFHSWFSLAGLSEREAAQKIHADGIHVLLDLAGHTGSNALPLFAWKPAPVQASWLGYWASTGVPGIDFLLADPVSAPTAHQPQFSERLWHLPDTRFCFTPPTPAQHMPPTAPPALRAPGGELTLGCFQALYKVGDAVLALWGRVFAALPNARLRMQNKLMADPLERGRLLARLEYAGIDASRVTLLETVARQDYLAAHAEVDFILDTFPYTGGTTTCEALWMGVPTLTLAGDTLLARQGASLLACAGLGDWIAESADDYVARALFHAADLPRLAALRARLRTQVMASPLFDAPRFARNLEQALLAMWRQKTGLA